MKKFAVFDIDGTIFRWQLYHELFDELYRQGHLREEAVVPVFAARDAWRNRKGSFGDYELTLVQAMEAGIIGLEEAVLVDAADTIITDQGDRIYHYTTELLRSLRAQGYTILAISGSQQQVVDKFAALYDISIVHGRQHTVVDGIITDKGPMVYGHKAEILKKLVDEHGLDWDNSYAIGDTSSDADMLELVTHPIAFNPDKKLYERARKEGWKIVVERKNIIYELSSDGNTFVLA